MSNPLDTHSYDGNIDTGQLPDIIEIANISLEEKKARGVELLNTININPIAKNFLNIIVSNMGTAANYDGTNKLCADDLICLCWIYRENVDFIAILQDQLMDMATGFCPQGRTHRLFQALLAFT
jgi:hypothetical protein